MFTLFYPLIALQAFCIYHAYKTRSDQKWYWMIILFPVIGCLIYLYEAFYSRKTVTELAEGLKQVVNSNYQIERLESALRFSNNAKNQMDLADAYLAIGRKSEAITLYEECLSGYMSDDTTLKMKLLHAFYLNDQFTECIGLGEQLQRDKSFRNAPERIALALAYHQVGQTDQARREFEAMDSPYSNYEHRASYAQHLMGTGEVELARQKVSEMEYEIETMKSIERKTHREAITKIKELSRQLHAR